MKRHGVSLHNVIVLISSVQFMAVSAQTPTAVPTPEAGCSRRTCDELGFPEAATFGSITVCGETDAASLGGACSGEVSWSEASDYCTSAGARLCTLAELENDEAADTGCNYNGVAIWSSSVCVNSENAYSYAIAYGSSKSGVLTDNCPLSDDVGDVYVRCCADAYGCTPFPVAEPTPSPSITAVPTSISTCSDKTCDELGWVTTYGSSEICGESEAGMGGCSGFVSWNDAKDTCQQSGARLCSMDELLDDEAKETGCNLDTELVWSGTACAGGYYAVSGSTKASDLVCTAISDTTSVSTRCCADAGSCTSSPTSRPTHMPSTYPTPSPSHTQEPSLSLMPTHPSPQPSSSSVEPTQPSPSPTAVLDCSVETCDDLGWKNAASYGNTNVCGETDTITLGGECSGYLTWDEARAFCQHGGARLCTADELLDDEVRGTGCNYDSELVWSGTACGSVRPYKDETFIAVMGASYTGGNSECYERTLSTVAVARCCADNIGCSHHPTSQPTYDGETPQPTHSVKPSWEPTPIPTHIPTHLPSPYPSSPSPTSVPSTEGPTESPTRLPTREPSPAPTGTPSHPPTHPPTQEPSPSPTQTPSRQPSHVPTHSPTPRPTAEPTHTPTHEELPTPKPTPRPSSIPTHVPTHEPTQPPTPVPYPVPTANPTRAPTQPPSHIPTYSTWEPTHLPSSKPSPEPSLVPTPHPSHVPTSMPSSAPTSFPTKRSACSSMTCSELGWDPLAYGHDFVCAMSEINDECSGALSFESAREFCQENGARLCEAHELAFDDARDSGCQLNGEVVWSGTPCANNQRSYYVLYGSTDGDRMNHDKDGTFGRQCKTAIGAGAEKYPVRCCADVSNEDCTPSPEPSHPPTPLPTAVPSPAPTSSVPTPAPSPAPTILPLTCASPAALYESLLGQTMGSDYTCSQVEISEVSDGLAQKFCKFAPDECKPTDLWESCTFGVRSSSLTVHAPPSYTFNTAPSTMFCMKSCSECLVK